MAQRRDAILSGIGGALQQIGGMIPGITGEIVSGIGAITSAAVGMTTSWQAALNFVMTSGLTAVSILQKLRRADA